MAWYEWLMAGVILAGTGGVAWTLYGEKSGPTGCVGCGCCGGGKTCILKKQGRKRENPR